MSEGPKIYGYHAHVYYDADTKPAAERLHQGLAASFRSRWASSAARRLGRDRQLMARGWVGSPGQRRRLEAFGVRPLEELKPTDIEYMAFGPAGQQTPWVSDAKLCGSRGRGLPLTGFAIRLAPALRERYEVVYEGSFFESGVTSPSRNGEPCVGAILDDPLEAIRVRLIKRDDG